MCKTSKIPIFQAILPFRLSKYSMFSEKIQTGFRGRTLGGGTRLPAWIRVVRSVGNWESRTQSGVYRLTGTVCVAVCGLAQQHDYETDHPDYEVGQILFQVFSPLEKVYRDQPEKTFEFFGVVSGCPEACFIQVR